MDASSPPGPPLVLPTVQEDAAAPLPASIERAAVLVGLAALVPLPFVDELLRRWLLGRLFCRITEESGAALTPQQGWRLARRQYLSVLGCVLTLVWWPLKKLFRTVVYVFILKDAVDWSADALVRCVLVHHSAQRGALPQAPEAVWVPLDKTVSSGLQSPVSRWIRGRKTPPAPPAQPVVRVGSLAARLLRWAEGGSVLQAFESELDALTTGRPGTPPAVDQGGGLQAH